MTTLGVDKQCTNWICNSVVSVPNSNEKTKVQIVLPSGHNKNYTFFYKSIRMQNNLINENAKQYTFSRILIKRIEVPHLKLKVYI